MASGAAEPRTMSVADAARVLGVGRRTLYTMIEQGRFPAPFIRLGTRITIPTASVERLLSQGTPRTVPDAAKAD